MQSTRSQRSSDPERRVPDSKAAYAHQADDVAKRFGVDHGTGLSTAEVARRLVFYGPNRLREVERRGAWDVLYAQLKSLIVGLLIVAALLSFAFGHVLEGASVVVVIAINTALGFATELRAVRSMEALRRMGNVETTVRRDGVPCRIPAHEVVPGDLVLLEGGDRVTADARLVSASRLAADESTLTGESVPVDKDPAPVARNAPLAERTSMLFKGTWLTRGVGEAIVVATGNATELGKIAKLVEEVEDVQTPLEKRLERLGRQLLWVSIGFAVVIGVSGLVSGRDLYLIIETAIALAVATVPEGLPIVATMALARGMRRMAKRNALVEALSAVESLGSTSLILTDKTGTLTENRMTVARLVLDGGEIDLSGGKLDVEEIRLARPALEVAALCNDASLSTTNAGAAAGDVRDDDGTHLGDPMEVALLVAAEKAGLSRETLLREQPEIRQDAFDPALKMMATIHQGRDSVLYAVKGATESVVGASTQVARQKGAEPLDDEGKARWISTSERLAGEGYRVLSLAHRADSAPDRPVYENLTLLGLVALVDPPRADVRATIERCREAGIRLVMATGDQAGTAANIAQSVGLVDGPPQVVLGERLDDSRVIDNRALEELRSADVIARATPKQKLTLLSAHQDADEVVAMLGDGVNDAPALEKADIGVAMGKRGTQVAREAADMVLLDDQLSTIVAAIEQGRVIFDNIRKFIVYLLSCNLSEILVIGIASAVQAPLPLLPLQILFLNLVTDVFPAMALAGGEGHPGIMRRRPKPRHEPILSHRRWWVVVGYGVVLTAVVLGAFALSLGPLGFEEDKAVTISFLTLGFAQLTHVFNLAAPSSGMIVNEITRNPAMWGALGLCTVLLIGATYAPGISSVLQTQHPGILGWTLIAGASAAPPLFVQVLRLIYADRTASKPETR